MSAQDLPLTIDLGGFSSNVILRELLDCEATLVQDFPFLRSLNCFENLGINEIKCLMFIEGFTIAIFCPVDTLNVYVFDSHSRDLRGLSVPDGTSVLLQFDSLYQLEKYIQVFCFLN